MYTISNPTKLSIGSINYNSIVLITFGLLFFSSRVWYIIRHAFNDWRFVEISTPTPWPYTWRHCFVQKKCTSLAHVGIELPNIPQLKE